MEGTPHRYYHFEGKVNDIVNSILSLLLGKEYYQEASFFSNFINESQSPRYRKKIILILELMQKENLILIREPDDIEVEQAAGFPEINNTGIKLPSANARVYLRHYGRQVLTEGGFVKSLHNKGLKAGRLGNIILVDTKLTIIILITTTLSVL